MWRRAPATPACGASARLKIHPDSSQIPAPSWTCLGASQPPAQTASPQHPSKAWTRGTLAPSGPGQDVTHGGWRASTRNLPNRARRCRDTAPPAIPGQEERVSPISAATSLSDPVRPGPSAVCSRCPGPAAASYRAEASPEGPWLRGAEVTHVTANKPAPRSLHAPSHGPCFPAGWETPAPGLASTSPSCSIASSEFVGPGCECRLPGRSSRLGRPRERHASSASPPPSLSAQTLLIPRAVVHPLHALAPVHVLGPHAGTPHGF